MYELRYRVTGRQQSSGTLRKTSFLHQYSIQRFRLKSDLRYKKLTLYMFRGISIPALVEHVYR